MQALHPLGEPVYDTSRKIQTGAAPSWCGPGNGEANHSPAIA
jgi:hypothetical protein